MFHRGAREQDVERVVRERHPGAIHHHDLGGEGGECLGEAGRQLQLPQESAGDPSDPAPAFATPVDPQFEIDPDGVLHALEPEQQRVQPFATADLESRLALEGAAVRRELLDEPAPATQPVDSSSSQPSRSAGVCHHQGSIAVMITVPTTAM